MIFKSIDQQDRYQKFMAYIPKEILDYNFCKRLYEESEFETIYYVNDICYELSIKYFPEIYIEINYKIENYIDGMSFNFDFSGKFNPTIMYNDDQTSFEYTFIEEDFNTLRTLKTNPELLNFL